MKTLHQIKGELQQIVEWGEIGDASKSALVDIIKDIDEMLTEIGAAVAHTEGVIRLKDKT
jgi:hypothetical protein